MIARPPPSARPAALFRPAPLSMSRSASPPHVVHVIDELPPDGAQRLIVEVLHNASPRYRYSLLCMVRGGVLEPEFAAMGVPVHILGRKPGLDPGAIPALLAWFRIHRPDVVHTHLYNADSYARLAAWLARVPAIFTTRHSALPWPSAGRRRIARMLSRVSSATIACGAEVQRMLVEAEGIAPQRVRTVANGINLQRFEAADRARIRRELGLRDEQVLIGVIGRLHPLKGHADLLSVLAPLAAEGLDFQCVFVGGGDLRDELQAQIDAAGLGPRVRLLGQRSDVVDVLAALDIFAMPSRREGLPMALLEAMAMARPVLATAVGSIPEVIQDGENGLIVPPEDPAALEAALRRLLADAGLRSRLGAAARATVQARFSSAQTAAAYERLYDEALGLRPAAP